MVTQNARAAGPDVVGPAGGNGASAIAACGINFPFPSMDRVTAPATTRNKASASQHMGASQETGQSHGPSARDGPVAQRRTCGFL